MLEAGASVRSGAETAHLADTQRAHDRSAVRSAPADDLDVGGAAAEGFQIGPSGKDAFERPSVDFHDPIGVLLPGTIKNLRSEQDRRRGGIGVGLCRVAVLGAGQNRQTMFRHAPAGTACVIADQAHRASAAVAQESHKLGALP
jgi:hypothetical protein